MNRSVQWLRSHGGAHANCGARAQRGATLIVAMLMLIILSILAAAGMQTATLEERMAGAAIDRNNAFEAAEAALRDAETYTFANLTSASGFSAGCGAGLCLPSQTATPVWSAIDWQGGIPLVYGALTGATPIAGLTQQPRYVIELFPDLPPTAGNSLTIGNKPESTSGGTAFRITAMGWGKKPGTQVMLQSDYVKE